MSKLEQLYEQLDKEFGDEFMKPEIISGQWIEIDGTAGTFWYPSEDFSIPEVKDAYEGDEIYETKETLGYGARLQAPGYLDTTEWCVFETEEEAIEYLLETYGEE